MDNTNLHRNINLSENVLKWQPTVEEYAIINEMEDYIDIILAIMMQESGGRGLDVMQCSECSFNTKYPKKPNSIIDPLYSIDCGIKELKSIFEKAGVKGKNDIENLKIAIQSYNFGPGYIKYCKERGNHNNIISKEFSEMMALKNNWKRYGDPFYVDNVFQYYLFDHNSAALEFAKEKLNELMTEALQTSPPTKFDSAHFTRWCYKNIGINIPLTVQMQYDISEHFPIEEAIPGDLVFFKDIYDSKEYIAHVGIYQGNMEMYHADSGIGFANLNDSYWKDNLICVGRIINKE